MVLYRLHSNYVIFSDEDGDFLAMREDGLIIHEAETHPGIPGLPPLIAKRFNGSYSHPFLGHADTFETAIEECQQVFSLGDDVFRPLLVALAAPLHEDRHSVSQHIQDIVNA